ncbi:hypothetical protein D3C86_1128880 [compost metagenome]
MSESYIKIVHTQANGEDTVLIYDIYGWEAMRGTWPIAKGETPLESAISSLWSGVFEVEKQVHWLGDTKMVAFSSNVEGALDQFIKEFTGEDTECAGSLSSTTQPKDSDL